MSRKITHKLLQMMEEGLLDPLLVAKSALSYMSEDAVTDMAVAEEFLDEEDAESADDEGPQELDFDPDAEEVDTEEEDDDEESW